VEAGRIQGRQARALCSAGGRVLCVQGPSDAAASARRLEGLKETLGAGFELRGVIGDWTAAGGEKASRYCA
jgi:ABC-type sugar transport system substrate-binding protein